MSERTEERTRERESTVEQSGDGPDLGVDLGMTTSESTTASKSTTADESSGGKLFSARALLYAFVAVGAGMFLGGLIPLIPFTSILGVALGGFVYGLLASQRRYLEVALAGGLSAGVAGLLSFLPQAVLFQGFDGTMLFAIAGGIGLLLAVVGHYFGRDLRDGLTKELP
jgi:hypothetical protein